MRCPRRLVSLALRHTLAGGLAFCVAAQGHAARRRLSERYTRRRGFCVAAQGHAARRRLRERYEKRSVRRGLAVQLFEGKDIRAQGGGGAGSEPGHRYSGPLSRLAQEGGEGVRIVEIEGPCLQPIHLRSAACELPVQLADQRG